MAGYCVINLIFFVLASSVLVGAVRYTGPDPSSVAVPFPLFEVKLDSIASLDSASFCLLQLS